MENQITEFEQQIHLMRKNSKESIVFVMEHLFACLDAKKLLEDQLKDEGKTPISKRSVSVHVNLPSESEKQNKNEIKRLQEENARKEDEIQRMKQIFEEQRARKNDLIRAQMKELKSKECELKEAKQLLKEEKARNIHSELLYIKKQLKEENAVFMKHSLQLNKGFNRVLKEMGNFKNERLMDEMVKEIKSKEMLLQEAQDQLQQAQSQLQEVQKKNQTLEQDIKELQSKSATSKVTKETQTDATKKRNIVMRGFRKIKKRCQDVRDFCSDMIFLVRWIV